MNNNGRGSEWLRRNARPINFEDAKTSASWTRASNEGDDAGIMQYDDELGRYQLTLPGGDHHELLYVESDPDLNAGAGTCDCKGFRMHSDDLPGNACAHLAALRQQLALRSRFDLEVNREYVNRMIDSDGATANAGDEPEETTAEVVDVQSGPEAVNNDPTPDLDLDDPEPDTPAPEPPEESFAGPIADEIDDQYVMEMGGESYIRRAGYAVLAKREGLQVRTQILDESPVEGQVTAVGKVLNGDGDLIGQDYGTAGPPDAEDMEGADHNLVELAATRAATRALAWGTGAGLTAVSEVEPGEEVHSP